MQEASSDDTPKEEPVKPTQRYRSQVICSENGPIKTPQVICPIHKQQTYDEFNKVLDYRIKNGLSTNQRDFIEQLFLYATTDEYLYGPFDHPLRPKRKTWR